MACLEGDLENGRNQSCDNLVVYQSHRNRTDAGLAFLHKVVILNLRHCDASTFSEIVARALTAFPIVMFTTQLVPAVHYFVPKKELAFTMSMQPDLNPYASTTATLATNLGTDAESIRKQHLNHEASVKSIGMLYWLGGILGCLLAFGYLIGGAVSLTDPQTVGAGIVLLVLGVVVLCFSVFQIMVARGIGKLEPWSRIAATVISCIGLLGFPIGTMISAYFLYLLQSSKGTVVFSDQYKEVMAETPHIKYKTSIFVWILLGLVVGLIVFAILAVAIGNIR